MGSKIAIFGNEDAKRFLRAAHVIDDEVRTYMLLAYGMHPKNLRLLKAGDDKTKGDKITKEGLLTFKRAKNQKARRELLDIEVALVIWNVVKKGKLNVSNSYYEQICAEQGRIAIPTYVSNPVSPYTLRHTYILNQYRRFADRQDVIDFVAAKAGCTRDVVIQNYLDLADWERTYEHEYREPLNLTHWKFGEGLSDVFEEGM